MIFGELLALIALLGAGGLGLSAIFGWHQRKKQEIESSDRRRLLMLGDLRVALQSNDYKRLDDFLVLHADFLPAEVLRLVELRKDELYIEKNP